MTKTAVSFLFFLLGTGLCLSDADFYFTQGRMTNYFSLNLDELYGASNYDISTTAGNIGKLTQPINLTKTQTIDIGGSIVKISMDGSQYSSRHFNGLGYLLDSNKTVYKSPASESSQDSFPVPNFQNLTHISAPKNAGDFSCLDLVALLDSFAVLCQYTLLSDTSETVYFALYIYDSNSTRLGTFKTQVFGNPRPSKIGLLYNADLNIMEGMLFVCVSNSYIQVIDIRDPKHPTAASIIDYTLDQKIQPINLKVYSEFLVILSQVGNDFYMNLVIVANNFEFTVIYSHLIDGARGISSSFAVAGNMAYFMTKDEVISLNILTLEKNNQIYSSQVPLTYQLCGSTAFMNFLYLSGTSESIQMMSYLSGSLEKGSAYSEISIPADQASGYSVECDPSSDVVYVSFKNVLSILKVGRPYYRVSQPVNATVTITPHYPSLQADSSPSRFVLQIIDQQSSFQISPSAQTAFSLFSGGSFTYPFSYTDIQFGSNISFSAGPSNNFDYDQKNAAFPLTSFRLAEQTSQILYNTNTSFAEYEHTIEPPKSENAPLFEYIRFVGWKTKEGPYKTIIFGCSAGGTTPGSLNIHCLAKYTLTHPCLFLGVKAITSGFMTHSSDGTYAAYFLQEETPYLTIKGQNWAGCVIIDEEKLVCIDSGKHVLVFQVAGSNTSTQPIYTLNHSIFGAELNATNLKESSEYSGVVAVSTQTEIYLYNFSHFSQAQYLATIDTFSLTDQPLICNFVSEKYVSVSTNTSIRLYEKFLDKGRRVFFEQKFSFQTDSQIATIGASENTLSVYIVILGKLHVIRAGEKMNGANNPIALGLDASESQVKVFGFDKMDLLIDEVDFSKSPILVYNLPLLTIYPELKTLEQDVYKMPVTINMKNGYSERPGGQKTTNLHFYVSNSHVNFTISPNFMEHPDFHFKSGGYFDVKKSGVFSSGSILFIYMNASNFEDIQLRINYTNPIADVKGSYLSSTDPGLNIVDLYPLTQSEVMLQCQKQVYLFKSNLFAKSIQYEIEIDGIYANNTSFYCMKGSFFNETSLSACTANGDVYLVFYMVIGYNVTKIAQVLLPELQGQTVNDLLLYQDLIVVQGDKNAYFYTKTEWTSENQKKK